MSTITLRNGAAVATHTVDSDWSDVVVSIPAAASVAGLLRNLEGDNIIVVKGGASAPATGTAGEVLGPFGAVFCDTSNIWVRAPDGAGLVSFETL